MRSRTTGGTHTRYIGDACVRIEHLGGGHYDAEISIPGEDDDVIWEAPVKARPTSDPDDPIFIDRLAVTAVALAVTEGRNARVRRATESASDEQGYVVERGNPEARRRKRMTLEEFKAAGGDTHQWREFLKRGYLEEVAPGVAEITQKMFAIKNPEGLTPKGERMYEHIKASYAGDPRAKEIAARTVLARVGEGAKGLKKNPSPEYMWFVTGYFHRKVHTLDGGSSAGTKIFSGWEHKSDAFDDLRDNGSFYASKGAKNVGVMSRRTIGLSGDESSPDEEHLWVATGPVVKKNPKTLPDLGVYGDGSLGHQHTRTKAAMLLEADAWSEEQKPGAGARLNAQSLREVATALRGEMSDDAWEEDAACEALEEFMPHPDAFWGWQDGDFGLWPIEN
jgi:hypothetical protein